jgi:hypothetical protein
LSCMGKSHAGRTAVGNKQGLDCYYVYSMTQNLHPFRIVLLLLALGLGATCWLTIQALYKLSVRSTGKPYPAHRIARHGTSLRRLATNPLVILITFTSKTKFQGSVSAELRQRLTKRHLPQTPRRHSSQSRLPLPRESQTDLTVLGLGSFDPALVKRCRQHVIAGDGSADRIKGLFLP